MRIKPTRSMVLSAVVSQCLVWQGHFAAAATSCREVSGLPTGSSRSDCVTVQPGAGIVFDGTLCTVGFVLTGTHRTRYAVTAGHCASRVGDLAHAEDGVTAVGRVVYREYGSFPVFMDSLVVQLFPSARSSGRAQVIDGPRGSFDALQPSPLALRHVGRGVGLSQVRDDRSGFALSAADRDIVHAELVVSPNDSGSPVFTSEGKAVGWVTDIASDSLADVSTAPPAAAAGWTVIRLRPVLDRASKALRTRLSLVSA